MINTKRQWSSWATNYNNGQQSVVLHASLMPFFETFLDYSSTLDLLFPPVGEYADGIPVDISHVSPFQPISTEF